MIEVSVVIPTHNRREILKRALQALFNQTYPPERYEIVLIDDGSSDNTEGMIRSLNPPCQLKYLKNEKRIGLPRTRNRGIKEAESEFIIFTDSDVIVVPEFIEQHLDYHKKYKDVMINGQLVYISNFQQVGKKRRGIFDISFSSFDTANVSVKKKFLIEAGLFDENFMAYGWADPELGYRLRKIGLKSKKNPRALGYHYKRKKRLSDLPFLSQKEKMRGISGALYYKKYPHLKVKLATKGNPLFILAFIGRWLEESKKGKRILIFLEKNNLSWLLTSLIKLITCYYYLQGFDEGIKGRKK